MFESKGNAVSGGDCVAGLFEYDSRSEYYTENVSINEGRQSYDATKKRVSSGSTMFEGYASQVPPPQTEPVSVHDENVLG